MKGCHVCEEAAWLADCGETLHGVARRLVGEGKRRGPEDALATHLRTHGRFDVLAQLRGEAR